MLAWWNGINPLIRFATIAVIVVLTLEWVADELDERFGNGSDCVVERTWNALTQDWQYLGYYPG